MALLLLIAMQHWAPSAKISFFSVNIQKQSQDINNLIKLIKGVAKYLSGWW